MSISDAFQKANTYWRPLTFVCTAVGMTLVAVYAGGRESEKIRNEVKSYKEEVSENHSGIESLTTRDLPAVIKSVKGNTEEIRKIAQRVEEIARKVNEDSKELKDVAKGLNAVKASIGRVETKQAVDSAWIMRSLERIEAKR